MADNEGVRRMHVNLNPQTAKKVEELARRLNMSQSKFIETLIDVTIENDEWLIKMVTNKWVLAFASVFKKDKKSRRSEPGTAGQ